MVDSGLAVDRVHGRVLWQVRNSGYWVVGAGSWVAEQGVDGLRGGVGEGRPDAGLDLLGAVEDLDVQGGEQVLDQGGRGAGEGRAQVGQFVEQGGVSRGGAGAVGGAGLGLGGGSSRGVAAALRVSSWVWVAVRWSWYSLLRARIRVR